MLTLLWVALDATSDGRKSRDVRTSLSISDALAVDPSGYARADAPRSFQFPADHGPHSDYRTEWWYYTGTVATSTGRRFGYQLTIFRTALAPPRELELEKPAGQEAFLADSSWSTRHLYMGHFALSDPESGDFHAFERFSRGAAGLAGADAQPYRVWLEDWSIAGTTADTVRVQASSDDAGIDLLLERTKPIVLQGEAGLDAKGPASGDASYYYSMTRLKTSGRITIRNETFDVQGLSWLDREWSTSALGPDEAGWDWFSLQFDDGRDLMVYRLRRRDGSTSPFSSGVVVAEDGRVTRLDADDVLLRPLRTWESPESGIRYPVEWALSVPSADIDLKLTPYLEGQELRHTVTYWEGAVRLGGTQEGSGFVELTGYGNADPLGM